MGSFSESSCLIKCVIFFLLPLTMIVHVVSLGTNFWVYSEIANALGGSIRREFGLFRICVNLKVSIVSVASSCEVIENAPGKELNFYGKYFIHSFKILYFNGIITK